MGCDASLIRLKGLTAKIETTCGVDAVPTPTDDAVQVEESFWNNLSIGYFEDNLRDDIAQSGLGRSGRSQPAGRFAEIEVAVALKGVDGAPTATNVPEWDALLRCCGVSQTLDDTVGSETLTYKPVSENKETATLYAYSGKKIFKLVGTSGTATLSFIAGQLARARFQLQAILTEEDELALPTFTYPQRTVKPPVLKATALALGSYEALWQEVEFQTQTAVASRPRGNEAEGNAGFVVTDWNPQSNILYEVPPRASFNPWQVWHAGTEFAMTLGPIGGATGEAQYNRLTLTNPNARIIDVPNEDQDGIAMIRSTIRALNQDENTPDSAWELEVA